MNNRDLVYKAFDLIEEKLRGDISVGALSESFGFSQYYFSRIFKGVAGCSLKDYLLGRKISEACRDLSESDRTILDIAMDYGFSSHEAFSRAFLRMTGLNPSELRNGKSPPAGILQAPLTRERVEARSAEPFREPEEVLRNEIRLVGIPFFWNLGQENDLSRPWENLVSHVSLIENRIVPERYYQLQYWFPEQDTEYFYFFIAVETERTAEGESVHEREEEIPIPFTRKVLPPQKYLRFYHKGRADTVGRTYDYIYNCYLPGTEYRLPHCYNFEFYGDECLGPYNDESVSEIYIPVEK